MHFKAKLFHFCRLSSTLLVTTHNKTHSSRKMARNGSAQDHYSNVNCSAGWSLSDSLSHVSESLWSCGENTLFLATYSLFHNFAGKSMKAMWFCGAKYEGSVILQGKVWRLSGFAGQSIKALWFCGAKSVWLHKFAGQSLHCSIIFWGKDIVSSAN